MTTQLLKETSFAAQMVPQTAWTVFDDTSAYVVRASVQQEGDRFSATAIRRPDISASGDSPDEAIARLQDAYKSVIVSSGPRLTPIADVDREGIMQAVSRVILIDDTERRNAIAARIPLDDDLELIANPSEPTE